MKKIDCKEILASRSGVYKFGWQGCGGIFCMHGFFFFNSRPPKIHKRSIFLGFFLSSIDFSHGRIEILYIFGTCGKNREWGNKEWNEKTFWMDQLISFFRIKPCLDLVPGCSLRPFFIHWMLSRSDFKVK
jgi:hypothetical protein